MVKVAIYTKFTPSRGSFEQIAEIVGLSDDDIVVSPRKVEASASDFADFRRYAKNDKNTPTAQAIYAAL